MRTVFLLPVWLWTRPYARTGSKRFLVTSPVLAVVQGDVGHLVTLDPLQEVRHGFFFVAACVVGTTQLHLLWMASRTIRTRPTYVEASQGVGLASPTLIFSAMISGSSHMDSTKKTCSEKGEAEDQEHVLHQI